MWKCCAKSPFPVSEPCLEADKTYLKCSISDPLSFGGTKKWGLKIQFSTESILFETKSKMRSTEINSNCLDNYRPLMIGFVHVSTHQCS